MVGLFDFGVLRQKTARSRLGRPSATAESQAFLRCVCSRPWMVPDRGVRLQRDGDAVFLRTKDRLMARFGLLGMLALRRYRRKAPSLDAASVARTHLIDSELHRAIVEDGVRQVVIMGAGYDSRAQVNAPLFREHGVRVVEVDAPETQRRKRKMLSRAGAAIPGDNVHYVSCDFSVQCLDDVLRQSCSDPSQLGDASLSKPWYSASEATFFVWEGVTWYLSTEEVRATLQAVRRIAPVGSKIVFDYPVSEFMSGLHDQQYPELARWRMAIEDREPFRFIDGISEGADGARRWLACEGFSLEAFVSPQEATQRYLVQSDGTPWAVVPRGYNHVVAVVGD